jgi:hypothetical protein
MTKDGRGIYLVRTDLQSPERKRGNIKVKEASGARTVYLIKVRLGSCEPIGLISANQHQI